MSAPADRLPRLHVVTDDGVLAARGFVERAAALLRAHGAGLALHVRGPSASGRALYDTASALVAVARETGATLLVNDRVDVALLVGAHGVQLGARSLPAAAARRVLGPDAWLGRSVHAPRETGEPAADYFVFGTVFGSRSHPGRAPAGRGRLRSAVAATDRPVLAIGGVTPERVAEVLDCGAHGVVVLSGIWAAERPTQAAAAYLGALDRSAR